MKLIGAVRDLVSKVHVAYLRRKILSRQLEGLVDPEFLDRALAGERKS